MGKKRGNGEGSIFKNRQGRWIGKITLGYDAEGRQLRKEVSRKRRHEVVEELERLKQLSGLPSQNWTVAGWLEDYINKKQVRSKTQAHYLWMIKHIVPHLGHLRLREVSALQIRSFYDALAKKELSDSTYKHIHTFLSAAFTTALRLDIIDKNIMHCVDPPKGRAAKRATAWTKNESRGFLRHAQDHRLYALFYILLTTGIRSGEALALTWDDVQATSISINKTLTWLANGYSFGPPKTEAGRRVVHLSADQVEVLEQQRQRQLIEASIRANYRNQHKLIFAALNGKPLRYRNVQRGFDGLCARAGVPRLNLHNLRHTYISLARQANIQVEVVASLVGHSDTRLTLNIYRHLDEQERAKAALGKQLFS